MKAKRIISIVLTALIIFSVAVTAFAAEEAAVSGSNWMSAIDGEKKITAITVPGTHDSATANADFNSASRTQSLSVTGQLYAGVRYFDIRLKLSKGTFYSVHSLAYNRKSLGPNGEKITADDIIADFKAFLESNPRETVLMLLKEEGSSKGTDFYTEFYKKYIQPEPDLWYVRNDHIPSLNECRGKIVVFRYNHVDTEEFDNTNSGISFDGYPYVNNYKTKDFYFTQVYMTQPEDETKEEPVSYAGLYVQDSFRLAPDKKWIAVSSFLSNEHKPWWFSVCVTSSASGSAPYYNVLLINERLMNYPFRKGVNYGIISVDFANEKLCETIYSTNEFTRTPSASTTAPQETQSLDTIGSILLRFRNLIYRISEIMAQRKISKW